MGNRSAAACLFVSVCNVWGPFGPVVVTDRDEQVQTRLNVSICNNKGPFGHLPVTDRDVLLERPKHRCTGLFILTPFSFSR